MMEAAAQEGFKQADIQHKRGEFPVVNVGVTMGLGATYPTNLATGRHKAMMDNLLSHPAIIQMANFADAAFNLWAPHLHKKYRDHLFSLWDHHPNLRRIFTRSIYPAAAFNFGPNVFTVTHRDCMNAPGGLCAIQALGNFDSTKGGHMVFPNLGLVVEFPPGALILVPSAIVTHGNIPVQQGDVRASFTQYCAGGLFRFVQNGFCTEAVLKRENPKEYIRISSLKATRWANDYELFSRLPARYQDHILTQPNLRDVLPEPLTPVQALPTGVAPDPVQQDPRDEVLVHQQPLHHAPVDTYPNAFQVFRRYEELPTHDPESYVAAASLSNVRVLMSSQQSASLYAPYPNRNAFKLGSWYWNDGIQKSAKSFQSLLKVVGHDDFCPEDVRGVNWTAINKELGQNEWDSDQWEDVDASWSVSSVSIKVPFHRRLAMPGLFRLMGQSQAHISGQNAFSKQLGKELGPTWSSMFVVDQMHEIELGVWKHLFIHLLRILESLEQPRIHELDRRVLAPSSFRVVPPFGADTIRKFGKKVSELKKMAARDYEDILQVAIPIFEGLLDGPHDSAISDLLFRFAYWHGLAKLRLHSDRTLEILDQQTTHIGHSLRAFKDTTCPSFQTRELKRELEARSRRQASKPKSGFPRAAKSGGKAKGITPHCIPWIAFIKQATAPDPQLKQFTLNGYKVHAMGDYVATIREYGTTDSYSTELGELEHRWPKGNYRRTSKKDYQKQLAQIERRQARLRRIQTAGDVADSSGSTRMDFVTRLKVHLLPRIKTAFALPIAHKHPESPPETPLVQENVYIHNDMIYHHKIMRLNYTTYDMRRAQDSFNPGTSHRDVMLLSDLEEGRHQFRYARILGMFHVNAMYAGPGWHQNYSTQALHVLWVRWLQLESDVPVDAPWNALHPRLDCVSFKPIQDPDAFGFVDPVGVLRGCHLIPRMAEGPSYPDGKGHSPCAGDGKDWKYYYINRGLRRQHSFVDRDMLMRYHWGLAAGHAYCRTTSSRHNADLLEGDHGVSDADGDEQHALRDETFVEAQGQPEEDQSDDNDVDDGRDSGSNSPSGASQDSNELETDFSGGETDDSSSEDMDEVYGELNDVIASFD
ncbi:hypothetical protein H0H92_004011 [Tricholoma furcatifolium]|nr:hypothetical protein H0H92_004011 [Tricholoma furcatifolium]